jgi:hypothetical protein
MDKKWFEEIGGYDKDIKFWGSEQYYLSFKVYKGNRGRTRNAPIPYQSVLVIYQNSINPIFYHVFIILFPQRIKCVL